MEPLRGTRGCAPLKGDRGDTRGPVSPAVEDAAALHKNHTAAAGLALHFICGSALSKTESPLGMRLRSSNAAVCDRPEFRYIQGRQMQQFGVRAVRAS